LKVEAIIPCSFNFRPIGTNPFDQNPKLET